MSLERLAKLIREKPDRTFNQATMDIGVELWGNSYQSPDELRQDITQVSGYGGKTALEISHSLLRAGVVTIKDRPREQPAAKSISETETKTATAQAERPQSVLSRIFTKLKHVLDPEAKTAHPKLAKKSKQQLRKTDQKLRRPEQQPQKKTGRPAVQNHQQPARTTSRSQPPVYRSETARTAQPKAYPPHHEQPQPSSRNLEQQIIEFLNHEFALFPECLAAAQNLSGVYQSKDQLSHAITTLTNRGGRSCDQIMDMMLTLNLAQIKPQPETQPAARSSRQQQAAAETNASRRSNQQKSGGLLKRLFTGEIQPAAESNGSSRTRSASAVRSQRSPSQSRPRRQRRSRPKRPRRSPNQRPQPEQQRPINPVKERRIQSRPETKETERLPQLSHGAYYSQGGRENNEDFLGTAPNSRNQREWQQRIGERYHLAIVADGGGGYQEGEVASQLAVKVITRYLLDHPELMNSPAQALTAAVKEANHRIYEQGSRSGSKSAQTTVTARIIDRRTNKLYLANVGDSRTELIRGGKMAQLTIDHSWVAEQVQKGLLTEQEAAHHPNRNMITRSLGSSYGVDVDTFAYNLQPGDIVLSYTDGLLTLSQSEIEQHLAKGSKSFQRSVQLLGQLADYRGKMSGGGHDNITVHGTLIQ